MHFEPKCDLVDASKAYCGVEVLRVNYDVTSDAPLFVDLSSESHGDFRVSFDRCSALRVIDEGQICEFWNAYSQPNGWLWIVRSGGWFDLESQRDQFWLRDASHAQLREYLIVGDQCVFVLSYSEPLFGNIEIGGTVA